MDALVQIFIYHFFHFRILDENSLKLYMICNMIHSSWTSIGTMGPLTSSKIQELKVVSATPAHGFTVETMTPLHGHVVGTTLQPHGLTAETTTPSHSHTAIAVGPPHLTAETVTSHHGYPIVVTNYGPILEQLHMFLPLPPRLTFAAPWHISNETMGCIQFGST